jgi:hypothetical protein
MSTLVKIHHCDFNNLDDTELQKHIFPEDLIKIAGKVGGGGPPIHEKDNHALRKEDK